MLSQVSARPGASGAAVLVPPAGYALLLTVKATQVWGGIFPFLPAEFQTDSVTLFFYLAQISAYTLTFAAALLTARSARPVARSPVLPWAMCAFLGSALVIAAMYAGAASLWLVVAGGVLLGCGSAALSMLWQRYFSSVDETACNRGLMLGAVLAAAVYFSLYLVPMALTAFLLPTVLLPVCALCLLVSCRKVDYGQAMFEDVPRDNPQTYRSFCSDLWRSAVAVAALGLVSGCARGMAVSIPQVGEAVNAASMLGMLAAALLLMYRGSKGGLTVGVSGVFRLLFPVVTAVLLAMPVVSGAGMSLCAGLSYLAFSLISLVMMMQCAQASRDRGVRPGFALGFFSAAAFAAQGTGFVAGWFVGTWDGAQAAGRALAGPAPAVLSDPWVAVLALVGACAMGMALFVLTRPNYDAAEREDAVELIPTARPDGRRPDPAPRARRPRRDAARGPSRVAGAGRLVDRLSKQCVVAKGTYGLSRRESEVMELIARGQSVASIAAELVISENTVRTHSKHLYTKLGIHSRQELVDLLGAVDLSALGDEVI